MVETEFEALRSGGRILENGNDALGTLVDSSSSVGNLDTIQERFATDGYLYLKSFFPRAEVLKIREQILDRMREHDLVRPVVGSRDALANPARRTAFMPELANDNSALKELIYGPRVMSFYEGLLGSPVIHYDFTWFRPVGPGRGTAPHCDLVYMGRGTRKVCTMWVPYGDVPARLGGLMVLEKSHRKSDLLRNYLSRDVDSYCANRPGAEKAQKTNTLLWDGKLAKDPVSLRQKLGGRWLTAEYEAGDMVTFSMTLVHGSLDNQTDEIRLSSDSRYQLANESVDDRWIGVLPSGHSRAGKVGRIC